MVLDKTEMDTILSQEYTGEVLPNGIRQGKGTVLYANRFFKFTGDFVQGRKQGDGVLYFGDGGYYEGEFDQDEITGKGMRVYPDGATYLGQFVLGEKQGEGVQTYGDGTKYEGSWDSNKYHGSGELSYPNGDTYIGEFAFHRKRGQGVLQCANGDTYDGDWVNDLQEGRGTAVWSNGDIYQGQWKQGKRWGKGKFVDGVSQVVYEGDWVEDQPTQIPSRLSLTIPETESEDDQQEELEPQQKNVKAAPKASTIVPTIEATINHPWNGLFPVCVLQDDGKTIVDHESGRVLAVKYEKEGEELSVTTLCHLKTEKGMGVFAPDAVVSESLTPGEVLDIFIVDETPGMREEELLESASTKIKILADPNNTEAAETNTTNKKGKK